jgi:FAD/FMN-containing dehydrogenase
MSALREKLRAIVGPAGIIDQPSDMAPYLVEQRGLYQGETALIVRPASTAEVAAVVKACAESGVAVVPQGGNTGLVGGQIPFPGDNAILLSLSRMNRIQNIDLLNDTVTLEAGVTLAALQAAARDADRLFPLHLASGGSAQLGGVISTNAGGNAVLRYGMMRELVLGLEAVLPDGRIWNGLRGLRKDNTGYDLKQLFIGGEGTLGVVTRAVVKLFALPRSVETAMAGVAGVADAVALLPLLRAATGDQVTGFELLPRNGLEFVLKHIPGAREPMNARHPWYVLIEISSGYESSAVRAMLESSLADAAGAGLIQDAVVAASKAQARALWGLRENLPEAQKFEGGSIKHDVSVPVSGVAAFIARASAAVAATLPGIRPVPFGHIGDGNVHFNLSQPPGMDMAAYLARWDEFAAIVHDIVADMGGSISAEHGLGRMKREEITRYKSPLEMELMRTLKHALDPKGLMNPGKLV